MARVDYFAVTQEIKTVLAAAADLASTNITVEHDVQLGFEQVPWVNIRILRRAAPEALQPISAGMITKFLVDWLIECWTWHPDGPDAAADMRDDLIGKVEVALMNNRTLNSTVTKSWLLGGEFRMVTLENDWLLGGQVILQAEVKATT